MTSLTDQQRAAVYSVDKNVLVSAGAGSGKTHVLVERYVEILKSDPALTVENLIAVTFTRKAAGEMRTRLKVRFKGLADEYASSKDSVEAGAEVFLPADASFDELDFGIKKPEDADSNRWRKCLADIDAARIGTIHSLCEAILKAFPAESGIDPQFEVIDEVTQAELLEESIDQSFREAIMENKPELVLFEELNIEAVRHWLVGLLKSSLQFEESAQMLLAHDDEKVLELMNRTRHRIQMRLIRDMIVTDDWKRELDYLRTNPADAKLEDQRLNMVEAASYIESTSEREQCDESASADLWNRLYVLEAANLRIGGKSEEAKAIRSSMKILRELSRDILGKPALPAAITEDALTAFAFERHLGRLYFRAQAIYSEKKNLDLKLDYNDLIRVARDALRRDNSLARQYFQERTRAILVDEFQDTNKIQAELISFLAGPQTRFFLIGDDKQSIYKFQGADVSNFNEWRDYISGRSESLSWGTVISGECQATNLTMSFRSHPHVVDFVNAVFATLLPDDIRDAAYRASFEPLLPTRLLAGQQSESEKDTVADSEELANGAGTNSESLTESGTSRGSSEPKINFAPEPSGEVNLASVAAPVQLSLFQLLSGGGEEPKEERAEQEPKEEHSKKEHSKKVHLKEERPEEKSPSFGEPNDAEDALLACDLQVDGEDTTIDADDTSSLEKNFTPAANNVEVLLYDALDEEGKHSARDAAQIESRAVADWIYRKVADKTPVLKADGSVDRTLTYGDCAVLVPRNSDFATIESALAERDIPYLTFAGRGFLNRQEIIDLENLLYFLGNPLDSHALLGVLRSPMFALSDDIIHEIYHDTTGDAKGISLWEAMQLALRRGYDSASRSGLEGVSRAVHLLKRFIEDATRMPLVGLIRNIIQATNYDLVLLSAQGGKQRSRNVWKLVSVARDHEDLSCHDFAQKLTLMREFAIKQSDAPLEGGDAVKLMTIHASKGLEFPLVALPALSGNVRKGGGKLIYHRNFGFALNTSRTEDDEVPVWYSYASLVDIDMEVAERKRLLYVAMTRARDYLGIFLDQEPNKRESFRLWLMDLLNVDGELMLSANRVHERVLETTPYTMTFLERDKLVKPFKKRLDETFDAEPKDEDEQTRARYDLIDRIEADPITPSSPWSGWTRVTPNPEAAAQELDATIIGTYFHAILEHLPADGSKPDKQTLRNLAINQGSVVAHPEKLAVLIEEGAKLLDAFYESDLCPMMKTARKRFSELPYLMVGEFGIKSKRPDLLLQDKDGNWLIIDYKTDSVPLEELDKHARLHYKQLQAYVNDLRTLTGEEFTPMLYFARHARLVNVRSLISKATPSAAESAEHDDDWAPSNYQKPLNQFTN